jgi:NHL repeat
MNKYIILIAVLFFCAMALHGQVISSVGFVGCPGQVCLDRWGNIYSSNVLGNVVVKLDTNGIATTIAGNGTAGFFGDGGLATNAMLNEPSGVAVAENGDVYVADGLNYVIRKVESNTGIITTIAGTGFQGYAGDGGPATAAWLGGVGSLQFDPIGNLYFVDGNYLIRKIDTFGVITTIAGDLYMGISEGDGGIATSARILPKAISLDKYGSVYMCGVGNGVADIRKVDTNGIIYGIVADTTSCSYNGDSIPATSACLEPGALVVGFNGSIYFTDVRNRIRYIDTFGYVYTLAGNGVSGYGGDGGPASAAIVGNVYGITMDHCGNLYFGEVDHGNIRKITFDSTCPHAVAGVRQQVAAAGLQLSPNPATAVLHVAAGVPLGRVSVMNPAGETVCSVVTEATRTDIPIEKLPPGLYLLRQDRPAGETSIRKFIKR